MVDVNNQRSQEQMEGSVDSVHQLPQLPLLVGRVLLLLLRGQHTLECQRGILMLVWQHMIIRFLASLHLFSKLMIKGYITIPKMTGLLQPHIMLLQLIMVVILVVDYSLRTSHTCN